VVVRWLKRIGRICPHGQRDTRARCVGISSISQRVVTQVCESEIMTMAKVKIGDRIGAILSVDGNAKIIEFLGYGVYEGQFPVEALAEFIEGMTGEKASQEDILNPRMKLDNGQTVWGYQVWWGPEDAIKDQVADLVSSGFKVKNVVIDPDSYL